MYSPEVYVEYLSLVMKLNLNFELHHELLRNIKHTYDSEFSSQ